MAGGGVGEAMLIGAAVGAGTGAGMSAIQKKDPLEGAIVGALGGAATGGLGSALGSGATSATQALGQEAVKEGVTNVGTNAVANSLATDATKAAALQGIPQSSVNTMMQQSTQAALGNAPLNAASYLGPGGSSIPGIGSATSGGAPILSSGQYSSYGTLLGTSPQSGAALNAGVTQPATGGVSDAAKWMAGGKGTGFAPSLTNAQAYGAGAGGGIGGILSASSQGNQWAPEAETYSGPLSQFSYDPRKYQAAGYGRVGYAEGGITDLDVGRREAYTRGATEPVNMFAHGGNVRRFAGGGINFIRGLQPGGAMGDMTADLYGAQVEALPFLKQIEPGGFLGATTPGRLDYEERKKREEEQAAQQAMAARQGQIGVRMARGGIADLGGYSDGGRLTRGPGDGMSDSIPASIGSRQPARLADGEFVVPADVVSHLGNGSTDAGAKQLYSMMDKVRTARTGNKRQGREINPRKYMPA